MRIRNYASFLLAMSLWTTPVLAQIDVLWDGGDGEWNDPNWNGGMTIESLVGQTDGADGYNGSQENIVIGSGATVNYNANDPRGDGGGSDFEIRQGANFTITDGASFTHLSDDSWSENRWTELDLSNLVIDNGSFIRTGSVREEGGGALIFGSWQGDDTFNQPESPDHLETNILITNGGRLINEGQLWIGSWDDTPPNGSVIGITINDGELDLTGGDVIIEEDLANADLIFSNRFNINDNPDDQPTYSINFTGPGSITVDSSGIVNAFKEDSFLDAWDPVSLQPITYQQLWDAGILQANGESGPDGANFSDFFTTENQLGQNDYKLISQIPGTGGPTCGNFDGDNDVDTADRNIQVTNWTGALMGGGTATFDQGDCDADGDVDTADQNGLINNWTGAQMAHNGEGNPDAADLIYDPATGNVTLDAGDTASGKFISFVLASDANNMLPENLTKSSDGSAGPFFNVGTNTDATTFQIGQTDPLNQGAGPLIDLGNIFPAGMDNRSLGEYLKLAEYASELGVGGTLDLVWIPEPSGLALGLLAALGMLRYRRSGR